VKRSRKQSLEGLKKVLPGMIGKAEELGWSANHSLEEVDEALRNPKFVYVNLREIWGPWKRGKLGNKGGFALEWGADKIGFGEIQFCLKGGRLVCDTECMGKAFVEKALLFLINTKTLFDPK
jgi:hypothetical protein